MSAPNDLRQQQAERIWQLEKELTAERTARETAERERDDWKRDAEEWGEVAAIKQRECSRLRAKLAALEAQPAPSIVEAAKEIAAQLAETSYRDYAAKLITPILTRLQADQSGEVARLTKERDECGVKLIEWYGAAEKYITEIQDMRHERDSLALAICEAFLKVRDSQTLVNLPAKSKP